MEQFELLRDVVDVVERLSLKYLVTGSVATIFFGEPRFTNDLDFVIALPLGKVADFCREFPAPQFYVSIEAAQATVTQCSRFKIIHPESGLKVDVIVPADTDFNRNRFARALRVKPEADFEASFASTEDVIIKKLEYYREEGSEKHLRDITGVLKISGDRVDRAYISAWASKLGLDSIWAATLDRVREEASCV